MRARLSSSSRVMGRLSTLLGAMLLHACATGIWNQEAVFPEGQERWTLPLYRPLTSRHLKVWVNLHGPVKPDGSTDSLARPMMIDSGGSSTLPRSALKALGIEIVTRKRVIVTDGAGKRRAWRGALVPSLQSGPLKLEDIPVMATRDSANLGHDVLVDRPWGVDLDRGVFELGAPAWSSKLETSRLPISGAVRERVTVRFGEGEALLMLDTGATHSYMEDATARELGLVRRALNEPMVSHTIFGTLEVRWVYDVKTMGLGGHDVGQAYLFAGRDAPSTGLFNTKVAGILGMNVLSRFRYRIVPSETLEITERVSLLQIAAVRVARWPWVPRCELQPGCVSLVWRDVEDVAASFELRHTKDYTVPAEFLFGCLKPNGELSKAFPFIEITVASASAGRPSVHSVATDSELWKAMRACQSLPLLDVNPVPADRVLATLTGKPKFRWQPWWLARLRIENRLKDRPR